MNSPKLVTVYGATGTQGRSVIKSLLQNKSGQFRLRGITRNPESDSAKSLAALGANMVKLGGLDKEEIVTAFKGSWAIFLNTMPGLAVNGLSEKDIGKLLIDAAAEAGVEYVVYSGLASAYKATNGDVPCSDFDEKAIISEYVKTKGFKGAIIASPGSYMESVFDGTMTYDIDGTQQFGGFPFKKDGDGFLTLRLPRWGGDDRMPLLSVADDFGDIVHAILLNPDAYHKQFIQAYSENITAEELIIAFQKATGQKSRYIVMDDWRSIVTKEDPMMEVYKTLLGFCYESGGKYYNQNNDITMAKELKALAAAAKGHDGGDAILTTTEEYVRKHWPA